MPLDMTDDNQLRELLGNHVDSLNLGELAGAEQIGASAVRRRHRTRLMGGLATVAVVALMLIGVGTALREPDPSTLFADQPATEYEPWQVSAFGDGYLALAAHDWLETDELGNVPLVVVTSRTGTDWIEVADSPTLLASSSVLAVHDDVVHIVTTRAIEPALPDQSASNYVLEYASSVDLAQWETSEQPLPDGVHDEQAGVRLFDAVAADAGVLVLADASWVNGALDRLAANTGIDTSELCRLEARPRGLTVRECGTVEPTVISIEASSGDGATTYTALFAAPGEDFVRIETGQPSSAPYSPPPVIYRAGSGFGIASDRVIESVDGVTWEDLEVDNELPDHWLAAAQGSERLFRSRATVVGSSFAPNQPPAWGFSSDGGQSIEYFEPDVFPDHYRWFSSLEPTTNGWLLIAGRTLSETREKIEIEGLTQEFDTFELTEAGFTLAGELPYGPATLTDETGRTVRTWDQFEPANVTWSGLAHTADGVELVDEISGARLVEFTAEQWSGLVSPPDNRIARNDILFSPDAKTWTVVSSTSRFPLIRAVGDDELLVSLLLPAFDQRATRSEIVELPTN